jgi:hypothetical protein
LKIYNLANLVTAKMAPKRSSEWQMTTRKASMVTKRK